MTRAVLAPGKAMLIGEYAVLEGEPAVVAAVSVYARAVLGSGVPSSGFIAAAIREGDLQQVKTLLDESPELLHAGDHRQPSPPPGPARSSLALLAS